MADNLDVVPQVLAILQDLREKALREPIEPTFSATWCHEASGVRVYFEGLGKSQAVQDDSCTEGLSLLELQLQLMLDYVINVVMVMLSKVKGQLIAGSSPVNRLAELRVVLEKLRPLVHKFQYQLDKLVKTSSVGPTANDPLSFKPNPASLMSKIQGRLSHDDGGDDDDDDGGKEGGERSGVYVPPRVVAMPYTDSREHRSGKSRSRRSLDSTMMEELREEYSDMPVERSTNLASTSNKKELERHKEQEEYEERYFVRLGKAGKSKPGGRRGVVDHGLSQLGLFKEPVSHARKTGLEVKRKGRKRKKLRRSKH